MFQAEVVEKNETFYVQYIFSTNLAFSEITGKKWLCSEFAYSKLYILS
jgi:hypothetical protein